MRTLKMTKENAARHYNTWLKSQDIPHNYIVTTRWEAKLSKWDMAQIEHIDGAWICEDITTMPYTLIGAMYAIEGFSSQREFLDELYTIYGKKEGFYTHNFNIHWLRRAL